MPVRRERLGAASDGVGVESFVLTDTTGIEVHLLSWGATLARLRVPDADGNLADWVLGFDAWQRYLEPHPHLGGVVGRYANRIAHARFRLEGREHALSANEPPHHLHGGARGFDRRTWNAEDVSDSGTSVCFRLTSPDGEEGYPGTLETSATYTLQDRRLVLELTAGCDRPTVVNLTQHAYYHLGDAGESSVLDHELWVDADAYLPVDARGIPTGERAPVEGTALDFGTSRRLGERIGDAPGERSGYDHCMMLPRSTQPAATPRRVARLRDPGSGRSLELWCTQPALQLYTGNFLDGSLRGRDGVPYRRHCAVCLEPQHPPDAPNQDSFPSTELRPGETYAHRIELHLAGG